jgi:hypothetical protein
MADPGWLEIIGIRIPAAFAGAMGGIVGCFADGKAGFTAWLSYIGCGLITANFLAEPAISLLSPAVKVNDGVAGFIVGLGALAIARTIIGAIRKWHPAFMNGEKP